MAARIEVKEGATIGVEDGAYLVAWQPGDSDWKKVPTTELQVTKGLAETALQPSSVGTAAFMDEEQVVKVVDHDAAVADLQGQINDIVAGGVGGGEGGEVGTRWHKGTGAPTNDIGENNDYYLRESPPTIYGPKAAGAWPSTGLALGSPGAAGTKWHTGDGLPVNSLGADGDYYIDKQGWAFYGPKAAGVWPATGVSMTSGMSAEEMASMLAGTFVPVATYNADIASLQAQMTAMQEQLDALTHTVNTGFPIRLPFTLIAPDTAEVGVGGTFPLPLPFRLGGGGAGTGSSNLPLTLPFTLH